MTIGWDRLKARRTVSIRPSVFVNFREMPTHPDLIFFAGGAPPVECLPIERMQQAMAEAWKADPEVLYYGESEGYEGLRRLIAERMAGRGAEVDAGDVVVTNGSQQGLDLVSRAFLEPGDRVIVEGPTYFGAHQLFDIYEAEYLTVPVDDEGIIPSELAKALESTPKPKLIYLIPTFQNPTGVSLSPSRRREVIALSHKHDVPIVEDDPYGELWFRGEDLGPLRALDPNVIYLGTFSKTLAPALRMGWAVVPGGMAQMFTDAKEGADIQSDRIVQRGVVQAAADGWLDRHLVDVRAIYRARCDHMLACLEREMPATVRWNAPDGGFFIWVTLPEGTDADALLPECVGAGAAYIPGSAFYADDQPRPNFRLGFTTLPEERVTEGIARLGKVLRKRLG